MVSIQGKSLIWNHQVTDLACFRYTNPCQQLTWTGDLQWRLPGQLAQKRAQSQRISNVDSCNKCSISRTIASNPHLSELQADITKGWSSTGFRKKHGSPRSIESTHVVLHHVSFFSSQYILLDRLINDSVLKRQVLHRWRHTWTGTSRDKPPSEVS